MIAQKPSAASLACRMGVVVARRERKVAAIDGAAWDVMGKTRLAL